MSFTRQTSQRVKANRLMEKLTLVREEQPTNARRLKKVVRGDAGNVMEVRECSSKKA